MRFNDDLIILICKDRGINRDLQRKEEKILYFHLEKQKRLPMHHAPAVLSSFQFIFFYEVIFYT